jgi:membrane-associated phospholipid phosphatase
LRKETTTPEVIHKNLSVLLDFKTILAVFLFTVLSIKYLDAEIAAGIMHFIQSIHPLKKVTEKIPDLLLHFVVAATLIMWAVYLYRLHKKKFDKETQFLQLAATVLPAAYIVKTLLKFVFGRTSARSWLIHHQKLAFHWFDQLSSSFPSGHMLVFAAFGAAILLYYPEYRKLILIFLILLGAALVGTDYHFLSDVIAGAYLGIITSYSIWYLFEKHISSQSKT